MRLPRTLIWSLASLALAGALISGMATARPVTPAQPGTNVLPSKAASARTRHSVAMPFFSFKPRG